MNVMASLPLLPTQITGLVLAGGRGSRMGGVDKGLQTFQGRPLAWQALERLKPQVGPLMLNANRHEAQYRAMGVDVWPDAMADYPGPLAGMLAGLAHCHTPYLVSVPCDSPRFPKDLVSQMVKTLQTQEAQVVMAATREPDGSVQRQPVFCLMATSLVDHLTQALRDGERKIDRWVMQHRWAQCEFDDAGAFVNANTLEELSQLDRMNPSS